MVSRVKTSFAIVCPMMMMMTDPVMMETSGDDNQLNDVEDKFVYAEENAMGDTMESNMMTSQYPKIC